MSSSLGEYLCVQGARCTCWPGCRYGQGHWQGSVCVCVVVCVRVSVCMCVHMYSGLVVLLCILTCNSVYGQLVSCLRIVTILISLASKTFIRIEVFRSEFVRYFFFTQWSHCIFQFCLSSDDLERFESDPAVTNRREVLTHAARGLPLLCRTPTGGLRYFTIIIYVPFY